jgi:L-asparaginase II
VSWRSSAYRVLVRRGRAGTAEAIHLATAIAWVPEGERELPTSGPDRGDFVTYFRSGCKPFQALPLVESGHADSFGLGASELAVMCASHNGADEHVAAVRQILTRSEVDESELRCGFHFPEDPRNDARLRSGELPHSPIYHNCSGKHAGMLALAKAHGWPRGDYVDFDHPVQVACVRAVAEVCGVDPRNVPLGIDGCSAANPALPLSAMARGFALLAQARADGKDGRERALARLRGAMVEHPSLVAGEGRFCTDLIRATHGEIVTKTGAEGLQCLAVPARGAGVAIKVSDGARRAVGPAVLAFLAEQGWLTPEAEQSLERWARPRIKNYRGLEVGEITVEPMALARDSAPAPTR